MFKFMTIWRNMMIWTIISDFLCKFVVAKVTADGTSVDKTEDPRNLLKSIYGLHKNQNFPSHEN